MNPIFCSQYSFSVGVTLQPTLTSYLSISRTINIGDEHDGGLKFSREKSRPSGQDSKFEHEEVNGIIEARCGICLLFVVPRDVWSIEAEAFHFERILGSRSCSALLLDDLKHFRPRCRRM